MNYGLRDYQFEAIKKMKNGCILCGGVGSGKSRTAIGYFIKTQGGDLIGEIPMKSKPKDLYIITTARKRDRGEWELDLAPFFLSSDDSQNIYENDVIIDSWNNISKYKDISGAFFIFDEQRVVGNGAWVKSFLKIARNNEWILLSATPGDNWMDYVPVFIANGFFRNRTEFENEHCKFSRYCTYKKVDSYVNVRRLVRLRNLILVDMDYKKNTVAHVENVFVDYDVKLYKDTMKNRWNYFKNKPIENVSELCYELRRISNSHQSRLDKVIDISNQKGKVIIFYNYDYELELLKNLFSKTEFEVAEWNGHKHQEIPNKSKWVYLVQYTAGAEGWNCVKTDTIIFYSQNYSYKIMAQAMGRIDRLNTPFIDLYFYVISSHSNIDMAIKSAIRKKKKFNESKFIDF